MKYRELRKAYLAAGWELLRQNGSHQQWVKGGERETIAGKDSDEVPKKTLHALLKRLNNA